MLTRWIRRLSAPLGLAFTVFLISQALAAKVKPAAPPQEKPGQPAATPTALVGTVVAVVPESRAIIVEVPRETDVLRLGATMTGTASITAVGMPVALVALRPGSRVRIEFRRTATGDEATAIAVLREVRG